MLFMKVLELRVKNRALRAKNCELAEDNRRLSAENGNHDRMIRQLILAAERVLPDRESSAGRGERRPFLLGSRTAFDRGA